MKSFNIIGLDKNYEVVQLMRFTNCQWNRKYHEAGTFSIQLPVKMYDKNVKYVYTKDRPELGKITQVNYVVGDAFQYVQISGYFLEEELNRMVVYPKGGTNITTSPSWTYRDANAETVAINYFNAFKTLKATMTTGRKIDVTLDITASSSQNRGQRSIHYRNGEYLGAKCYWILKPSGMSYRVRYNHQTKQKTFECIKGKDLTQSNTEHNNPVIFSTKYGNILKPNILIDDSTYKNAGIGVNEQTENNVSSFTVQASWDGTSDEMRFGYFEVSENPKDYDANAYKVVLENEALTKLEDYPHIINTEFDTNLGSYEYMKDFDIGDLVDVEIPEVDISESRRIISCFEVMKNGTHTLQLELGDAIGGTK